MCGKDRGEEAIGERDILVAGFCALIGLKWRRSVQDRNFDWAFIEAKI